MRISVNKGDIGFCDDAWKYEVTLDGVLLGDCVMADEATGDCVIYSRDEGGNFIPVGDNLQVERRRGVVVVSKIEGIA